MQKNKPLVIDKRLFLNDYFSQILSVAPTVKYMPCSAYKGTR